MILDQTTYFVTGIGTNIGKTLVSSILVNSLDAAYWKPIQCGDLENTDSDFIRNHSNAEVIEEKYKLKLAASPHIASLNENIHIALTDFELPDTNKKLLVEGAGGMLVPLNDKNDLIIDIAKKWNLPLIIVAPFYLGSINHTLLTLEYARRENLKVAMVVFTGNVAEHSFSAIRNFFPDLNYTFIPHLENISKQEIIKQADLFKSTYLK